MSDSDFSVMCLLAVKPQAGITEIFAYGMSVFLPPWNPGIPGQATKLSDLLPNLLSFAKELYSLSQVAEVHIWKQVGSECIRQG